VEIIVNGLTVRVPIAVEAEGGAAIEAFVAAEVARLTAPAASSKRGSK
jgi:hypothetical protein